MSTTPNLLISLIAASQNNKEVTANTAFDDFDGAIAGNTTIAMADANQTLSNAVGLYNMVFYCTGAMTANRSVIVPQQPKLYIFKNNTTGGFSIVVETTATLSLGYNTVTISQGDAYTIVYSDGNNVWLLGSFGGGFNGAWTDLVNQVASISGLTAYNVPSGKGGLYEVSYYAKRTVIDGGAGSTLGGLTISFTDNDDSSSLSTPTGPTDTSNTLTAFLDGVYVVNAKGGTPIQIAFGYLTSDPSLAMAYSLHVRVKKL